MNISGRIAQQFQNSPLTPLLALVAFILGILSFIITPKEEEPQIDVTMVDVMTLFPGAPTKSVEKLVTGPLEQYLSKINDIKHVYSITSDEYSLITIQFEVGVKRDEALIRIYDILSFHQDAFPSNMGVMTPLIKARGIDDVPILTVTFFSQDPKKGMASLQKISRSIETEVKRIKSTGEVSTIGGTDTALMVEIDPQRLRARNLSINAIQNAINAANAGAPVGSLTFNNQKIDVEVGRFIQKPDDLDRIIVGLENGRPLFLSEVARISERPINPQSYTWHNKQGKKFNFPAVTLAVTKKHGENATQVADNVIAKIENLKNTIIPDDVEVVVTRNYGETASDKAKKLIEKLIIATLSVIALVFFALGRREALIVGISVILTLTTTLFASWAWGFTLNRVSLFALIFSIGILVDDAIVIVENIHRHIRLNPNKKLFEIIPYAVDEVGSPTILATFTVIAALLPMAFVSGLMGPYMRPIPINASMGMLISLIVAFTFTPWLSNRLLGHVHGKKFNFLDKIPDHFNRAFNWLLDPQDKRKNLLKFFGGILGLMLFSLSLPLFQLVVLKMLPFDNKSEFQIIIDMPEGTALEKTAQVADEVGSYLSSHSDIINFQTYVGTASPINFNGLIRQYYLRQNPAMADIQVNLIDKNHRHTQSHDIAKDIRRSLQGLAQKYNANIKIAEVPPGPPVLAPIVAEIYGSEEKGRIQFTNDIEHLFHKVPGLVDIDTYLAADGPKKRIVVDRTKAALSGVQQADIVTTLNVGLNGDNTAYLRNEHKFPTGIQITLPWEKKGYMETLLEMGVPSSTGKVVPLREFAFIENTIIAQPAYHKDLLPVSYVIGDMAGKTDSPLYGMFEARALLDELTPHKYGQLHEFFIKQPYDNFRYYSLKWDGEWQITYETFRDMGIAYLVGLFLIYVLIVAYFSSYKIPFLIMAPIPLTIIGILPGHALLHAQFTATSMIGMMALAGIIVRNSILLVDFIQLKVAEGLNLKEAIVESAIIRFQPIALTALAAMIGSLFILDDPIFKGLAISLIFGVFVSSVLTLFVIPILYYLAHYKK